MTSRKTKYGLLTVLCAAVVVAASFLYFWKDKQKSKTVLSKEEQAQLLQEHVQARIKEEYYQKMIPIYEKILEQNPNNEAVKEELAKMQRALEEISTKALKP